MKQLGTIGAVVLLLLGAAIYFSVQRQPDPTPTPHVNEPDPKPPTPKEKGPSPVVKGEKDGTLTLRAAISNGYLMTGESHEMYAAVDVTAKKYQGEKRPPLNVAVVIDRSGSMAGSKIEYARRAARRLANVLDERDRFSLISYGSDVTVDFSSRKLTKANRMELLRSINGVKPAGGTNLSGGFQRGFSEVNRYKADDSVNRVILMSDGHANVGITNPKKLAELASRSLSSEVSVSSIGMGLDYNEDLMTTLATEGAGNYHFVDKPDAIVDIFETELKGLANTVARNTALVIHLRDGVKVGDIYGFAHRKSGNKVYISLAEFHSEQVKNILMKLDVTSSAKGEKPIMKVELSYDDTVAEKPGHHALALKSVVTDDAAKKEEMVNVDVIARVQQVEVAESMDEAMKLYDEGDADNAANVLKKTQKKMRKRRKKYKFADPKAYEAADRGLGAMQKKMREAPSKSSEGKRMIKRNKAASHKAKQNSEAFIEMF